MFTTTRSHPPATQHEIAQLIADLAQEGLAHRPPPRSWLDVLSYSNGGDFENGERFFRFFAACDVQSGVRAVMRAYNCTERMPGAVPFALSALGTLYLFDMRGEPWLGEYPVVAASGDALGWEPHQAWVVAQSFAEACRDARAVETLRPAARVHAHAGASTPSDGAHVVEDVPAHTDIYLDGVPADGMATLFELRKLLGKQWPPTHMRNMLRKQPVVVEHDGRPLVIRRALRGAPHLAAFLFYRDRGKFHHLA